MRKTEVESLCRRLDSTKDPDMYKAFYKRLAFGSLNSALELIEAGKAGCSSHVWGRFITALKHRDLARYAPHLRVWMIRVKEGMTDDCWTEA